MTTMTFRRLAAQRRGGRGVREDQNQMAMKRRNAPAGRISEFEEGDEGD